MAALKRNSNSDMLNKLKADVQAATSKNNYDDPRFWEPTKDASGSGYAVLRFLPARNEGDLPFVKTYSHGFKSLGGWFIENCPTTINDKCPVCDDNNTLWNSGIESNKKIASDRKRQLKYIANVLVVKDPAKPELDGQVKMFRFGQKIMDKIQTALNGRPELGIAPKNVFGFFEGVNFNLVMVKVANFPNYDQSTFTEAPDLFGGEEAPLIELMEKMFDLNEFVKPEQFKPYDDLKARHAKVTGGVSNVAQGQTTVAKPSNFVQDDDIPFDNSKPASQHHEAVSTPTPVQTSTAPVDDDLKFFQSLAGN